MNTFCGYFFKFGGKSFDEEEMDAEKCRALMTPAEWNKVYQMSQDKNIYTNLCDSLFPTIHGMLYTHHILICIEC